MVKGSHKCYIRALRPHYGKTKERYVTNRGEFYFFDFETCVVTKENGKKIFEVNVACAMDESGEKKRVFKGYKALDAFCRWIFLGDRSVLSCSEGFSTFVSHNGSRFDMMFVLQWLCVNLTNHQPNVMFNQRSPMRIKLGKVIFIDSCLFIKSPLASLPSQFGLQGVGKGDFPHEFNLKENYNYVGPLPAPEYYGTRFMSEKRFAEFMGWWNCEDKAIRDGVKPLWNFKEEIVRYCMQDVDVLRRSWIAYSDSMFSLTGLYPGVLNVSAASFTNLVWKTTIESNEEIGVIPRDNYFYQDKQSAVAYEWLSWLDAFYFSYELMYAGKCEEGEKRVVLNRKYKVDGFHEKTKTIFEFAGCAVHGCDKCTRPDDRSVYSNRKNRDLKTEMDNRLACFYRAGYHVEVMWECEWKRLKEVDQIVRDQLQEISDETYRRKPIEPRDALYGGRTEVFSMFFDAECEEGSRRKRRVKGVDINSMYPDRMAKGKFPLGHPKALVGPPSRFDYSPNAYFGLVLAKVYPPRDPFFPVLPSRIPDGKGNTKLMFVLCYKCAVERNQEKCKHGDEERALCDTWCSEELYEAQKQGYKIAEITAVWDYGDNYRFGLFREFIKKFYTEKVHSSGYPKSADTREKRDAFLLEFENREGIKLDPAKMVYNAGNRSNAKSLLNSLWGKFAQNPKRSTSKLVHSGAQFIRFVVDPSKKNKSVKFINSDTALLRAEIDPQTRLADTKGNLVHAIFTTALSRLLLLKYLNMVGEDAFYCDTDSVHFLEFAEVLAGTAESRIPLDVFLGGMTEEFLADMFFALGAKNYGYRKSDGGSVVKVRGITCNRESNTVVNLSTMRDMLVRSKQGKAFVEPLKERVPFFTMVRGNKEDPFAVAPAIRDKVYKIVNDKRVVLWEHPNLKTLPYGY